MPQKIINFITDFLCEPFTLKKAGIGLGVSDGKCSTLAGDVPLAVCAQRFDEIG